jgi:hypothetical protein
MLQLQRTFGNRAVQRFIETARVNLQRDEDVFPDRESGSQAPEREFLSRLNRLQGLGSGLPAHVRALLEPRLGVDLSSVRVHTGDEAHELAGNVAATAFTTGTDIFFRDGAYNPGSDEGTRLIAHEVTHVLQQSLGPVDGTSLEGTRVSISDPSDRFEQEADDVAEQLLTSPAPQSFTTAPSQRPAPMNQGASVQREDDDGWFSGLGNLVESAGSAIASGAETAWNVGSSAVSDVGSAIASGAETAWDVGSNAVSNVGSAIASGAETAWDVGSTIASDVGDVAGDAWKGTKAIAGDVADFGKGVYGQMKEDAGYVQKGVGWLDHGIDWLEDEAKSGTSWLANKAEGIPVLEQLAGAGKSFVDWNVDVTGGALKGVTGMAGGILGMAADPVDAAKGLYSMAEHIPGAGIPLKALSGAYDLAFSDKSLGEVADETLNPMADAKYWGNVGKALWSPLQASIDAGKPGEALGNAGVQIAAMFTGAGEAGAAAEGTEAASVAAKTAEAASLAGEAGSAADAAKLLEGVEATGAADVVKGLEAGSGGDASLLEDAAASSPKGPQYLDPWPGDIKKSMPPLEPYQIRPLEPSELLPSSGLTPGTEQALAEGLSGPGVSSPSSVIPGSAEDMSFADLIETDTAPVKYRSAAEAAKGAEQAGLVDPSEGRLGFQSHNTAGKVRNILGESGETQQSAHLYAQGMYPEATLPPGASTGKALTTNLPIDWHGSVDRGWVPDWQSAKAGGKAVTAGKAHNMILKGIEGSSLPPAAKGTAAWRLFDEMFSSATSADGLPRKGIQNLGLEWDDIIFPGKP